MKKFVGDLRNNGAAMQGRAPSPLPTPLTPTITAIQGGSLSWRGAALAATYVVQTADSENGPWTTVKGEPTDNDDPWIIPGGPKNWVRLMGVGAEGVAGPWSAPYQAALWGV